ncbi:SH2 domain-containing protein 4A isoform X2 [Stegastes partitus]|uniref:SH2 domain-containing protein 4A isoform X2 n=1 Tax=Stegastes partitus TaxID=144197 RepID=A0A9Y4MYL8_9TELE|nr:PREDICTED: SH2 domain-containing protein 4A-like isoform X2 [Stegastes partitus]
MLAKILEDMWVEPEVLEALSEEQKRILFLKMREEQVRRWKEREEREEREGQDNARPKKASSKHVTWLLGRDGDVSVMVIGEVDEFRSSRLLQGLMNNRLHSDNMNGIQTADLLPGREAQQLGFKEDIQLPLADDDPPTPTDQSSEEDMDSCGADDDLKDPAEDSDSESGSSSDSLSDWAPLYRPHLSSHGNQPLKAQLSDTERTGAQDREAELCKEKPESRVAQLRKTFAGDLHVTSPACTKPPLPAKPAHLQSRRH